jgi:sulfur-carrier protein
MKYHIQVFAGLAEHMGGPMITVPTEQEAMTITALKGLFLRQPPNCKALLLPEIKFTLLQRS